MNNIRFVSLSSGSSGNCYYLGTDSYGILIDAGISARQIKKSLAANGIAFESIVALCITHDHADHIKGAGYVGEKCGVPVYTTQTILNGMNRCYCMTQKIYSVGRPILKDVPFTIRDFTITAFEVPHDGTDNVGYRIEAGGRCFVFATDLGCIPDSVAGYLQQAHCLILESNYDMEMLQQGPYPYYLKKRIVSGRAICATPMPPISLPPIIIAGSNMFSCATSAGKTIRLSWLIKPSRSVCRRAIYR